MNHLIIKLIVTEMVLFVMLGLAKIYILNTNTRIGPFKRVMLDVIFYSFWILVFSMCVTILCGVWFLF